jgi:hypothetical protein
MFCVSTNFTSEEWLKIQKQAQQQWPTEQLSRSEITRRFAMIGANYTHAAQALNKASKAELDCIAQELRASMTAPESERLKY